MNFHEFNTNFTILTDKISSKLFLLVVISSPIGNTISWYSGTSQSGATTNWSNLNIIIKIQITSSIIIGTRSSIPSVVTGHDSKSGVINNSTVSVVFVMVDSVEIVWKNAAFLVGSVKNGGILAATVVWISGGIRSSRVWFDWISAGVSVGHLVDVMSGSTVSTTASILSVVTGDGDAIVFFSKVSWVTWLKSGPSGVISDVPVHVNVSQTDGEDSITFANKPSASVTWSVVVVVLASDIDLLSVAVVSFTPFVTSFFWVATSTEIDINTFVAQSEFFADSIDWIDGLTVTRSQVMLTLWKTPASIVTVSSENSDRSRLHRHDHSFQVFESSPMVEGF